MQSDGLPQALKENVLANPVGACMLTVEGNIGEVDFNVETRVFQHPDRLIVLPMFPELSVSRTYFKDLGILPAFYSFNKDGQLTAVYSEDSEKREKHRTCGKILEVTKSGLIIPKDSYLHNESNWASEAIDTVSGIYDYTKSVYEKYIRGFALVKDLETRTDGPFLYSHPSGARLANLPPFASDLFDKIVAFDKQTLLGVKRIGR